MALEVNGAAILAAISKSPEAFAMSEGQINALAQTALLGRYKDKAVRLDRIIIMATLIAKEDFALSLDALKTSEVSTFAKRLDPKNGELKTADDRDRRAHILALAYKEIEAAAAPAKKAVRAVKPKTDPSSSKAGKTMQSKALRSRRAK